MLFWEIRLQIIKTFLDKAENQKITRRRLVRLMVHCYRVLNKIRLFVTTVHLNPKLGAEY